jgi:predicted NBD/HSP70 family sugar kinase
MLTPGAQQVSLANLTGLSQATVSSMVKELQSQGALRVIGTEGERGNRVHLGDVLGVAVGIEVGHDQLTVAARRADSSEIVSQTASVGAQNHRERWTGVAKELIHDLSAALGLDAGHVFAIGLGIPAAVNPKTAEIIQVTTALDWDLSGHPGKWFEDEFPGVPVIPDNEVNLAAYGEYMHGAGQNATMLLFVKVSTGVGAGFVTDGLIFRGARGFASELGHLTAAPSGGIVCRCGNRGCLETLIAGPRLLAQVQESYQGYKTPESPQSFEDVIRLAKRGDLVCRRVIKDAGRSIGLALAEVSKMFNPDLMVIGGALGEAGDLVVRPAKDGLRRHALPGMVIDDQACEIKVSALGALAGAQGALTLGLLTERPPRTRS